MALRLNLVCDSTAAIAENTRARARDPLVRMITFNYDIGRSNTVTECKFMTITINRSHKLKHRNKFSAFLFEKQLVIEARLPSVPLTD